MLLTLRSLFLRALTCLLAACTLRTAAATEQAPTSLEDLAASGAATALAQEGSVASRNRLCALAAQYGVQDLAVCGASPPSPPSSTITTLPPEIEDVLRAALRDQAALGGGIASRRSGLIPLGTSTLAPAQLAALAAATDPGGGDAATGVTSGLRPTRTRKLSTNELVGLTFGLVFSATFCGGLVWLGSRKEKYGRYF